MTGAETAAPARRARPALGANVRKLVGASAGANLADGISQVAYPWLASAVTRNPMLIALIAIAQQLPWLVLTLPAGVLADRTDRRLLMVGANVVRVVLSLGVGAAVLIAGDVLPTPDQLDVTGTVGLAWWCWSPRCCSVPPGWSTTAPPSRSCRRSCRRTS